MRLSNSVQALILHLQKEGLGIPDHIIFKGRRYDGLVDDPERGKIVYWSFLYKVVGYKTNGLYRVRWVGLRDTTLDKNGEAGVQMASSGIEEIKKED